MYIREVSSGEGGVPSCDALKKVEELVTEIEEAAPMISNDNIDKLRKSLALMPSELSEEQKLHAWRLSYRIWNTCVDMANNLQAGQDPTEDNARLRHIASDLLLIAGAIGSIRSSVLQISMFFFKTGCIWHKINKHELAGACFEKATELGSQGGEEGTGSCSQLLESRERLKFEFDLNIARAKTVWLLCDRTLACGLLGRAWKLVPLLPDHCQELAEQYLQFGKALLAEEDVESQAQSIKHMENALDICSEGINRDLEDKERDSLIKLKFRILRHLAAGHLQNENFESALKCVTALRESSDHPCNSYFALNALAGMGRHDEVEKELLTLVSQSGVHINVCASAIATVIQECGQYETAKKAFFLLFSRFTSNRELPVGVLEKLLRHTPSLDSTSKKRIEVALQIACDERILETVAGPGARREFPLQESWKHPVQQCIHSLLWNSGSDYFQARDYETSIKLFEASMLYLASDRESNMLEAKSLRVLCLCHLALLQFDRAAEVIDQAEKLDPNIACVFLKFKIRLQTNSQEEAIKQVEKMLRCSDFEPDYLTLASHEAISCKNIRVAIAALSNMLSLYSSGSAMTTKEVVVIRNIIRLALQDGMNQTEILKYFKRAQELELETGFDSFFGAGAIGQREASWFACAAWNQGLVAGRSHHWKLCAEFYALSSEFYAGLPDSPEKFRALQTALLVCVSALLTMESTDDKENLKTATLYLEKCRKVHASLASRRDSGITSNDSFVVLYLNLLAFHLKGKTQDHKAQLEILKRCGSYSEFTSEHFFKMAMHACNGQSVEVATTAFHICLNLTLSAACPDYNRVATIVRKLINLVDLNCKDGPEVLGLYRQANQILVGLTSKDYPKDEAQWLVSTAWNRAIHLVKFLRFSAAEEWMDVALDLLKHVPAMETRRPAMLESLGELLKQKGQHSSYMEE